VRRLHPPAAPTAAGELGGGRRRFDRERDDRLVVEQHVRRDVLIAGDRLALLPQRAGEPARPGGEPTRAAQPVPVAGVGHGRLEHRDELLLVPGGAIGARELVGERVPQPREVDDVPGGVGEHGLGQRPLRPVGALERLLVPVDRDAEDGLEQRLEAGRTPEQRGRDRRVRDALRPHAERGEGEHVVPGGVEDGEPVHEEGVERGELGQRDAVEEDAPAAPADLDEGRTPVVPVGVGPLDVDPDGVGGETGQRRTDPVGCVDERPRGVPWTPSVVALAHPARLLVGPVRPEEGRR